MKKALIILALFLATAGAGSVRAEPARSEDVDMLKYAGQACAFGGAVLGVSSLLVLYPALAGGAAANVPVVSLVVGNSLFGCGIAAVGSLAARGFSLVYDALFSEPATRAPGATTS